MSSFKIPEESLEVIKLSTLELLHYPIVINSQFSFIVHHPIFANTMISLGGTENMQVLDLSIPENEVSAKSYYAKLIENFDKITDIYMIINKPWRLYWLHEIMTHLSDDVYYDLLTDAWVTTEYPSSSQIDVDELLYMFERVRPLFPDLKNKFPGGAVTIYRGEQTATAFNGGLSWTLDKERARWFASRFRANNETHKPGSVATATVSVDDILGSFLSADYGESEVIVDFRKLSYQIEEV